MPRYNYECKECNKETIAMHNYKEILTDCTHCDTKDSLIKVLNVPLFKIKKPHNEEIHLGDLTNDYIEANKDILEDLKKESKGDTHEPS
jgi:putative FmdB family regulatory protein